MEITKNETTEGINFLSPEVRIPKEVRQDLLIGLESFFGRLVETKGKDGSPDGIVLPLRSALLPYEAVKGHAAQHKIDLPPHLTVDAGRKVSDKYRNEKEPPDDLLVSIMSNVSMKEYLQWLGSEDNELVQKAVSEFKEQILQNPVLKSKIDLGGQIRIDIWDDAVFQETTLLLTAPYMVARAFSELGVANIEVADNPAYKSQEFTKNFLGLRHEGKTPGKGKLIISLGHFLGNKGYTNDWRGLVINESFATVLAQLKENKEKLKVQLLLSELMRGPQEGEDYSWEEAVGIGESIVQRRFGKKEPIGGENPAFILERFYSKEDLLSLNKKVKEVLKNIGGALTW